MKIKLPQFPRTLHLPFSINRESNDVTWEPNEFDLTNPNLEIFEKIDGSNVCFSYDKDLNPRVRNKNYFLIKGFKAETAAQKQYLPIWSWLNSNKKKFSKLENKLGTNIAIFGEWMYATHGIIYNKLPDKLIIFDIYDLNTGEYIPFKFWNKEAIEVSYNVVPLLNNGPSNINNLNELLNNISQWSNDQLEGLYLKISNEREVVQRAKVIRNNFTRGQYWNSEIIIKNQII